ncbi:MAG: hypothetical protein IPN79_06650 [Saprospiraceae bacterium]|nr:hypothetical protein [Saprospiraceae bacterium]
MSLRSQDSDYDYAQMEAQKLKESVLVVRVPVNGPKIRYLKTKIKESVDIKILQSLQEELDHTEKDNQNRFETIREVFKSQYTFSDVLFLPDSSYLDFENDKKVKIYKDSGEEILITKKPQMYFLLVAGENADQWILVNDGLKPLDKPFPYRATVFMSGFRRVFYRKTYYKRQISWFQKKLDALLI